MSSRSREYLDGFYRKPTWNISFFWVFSLSKPSSNLLVFLRVPKLHWKREKDSNRYSQVNLKHLRVNGVNADCLSIFKDSNCVLYLFNRRCANADLQILGSMKGCHCVQTCSSQSSGYLVKLTHITFFDSLICFLGQLISEVSLISSGVLLNYHIHCIVLLFDKFPDPFRFWIVLFSFDPGSFTKIFSSVIHSFLLPPWYFKVASVVLQMISLILFHLFS